MTIWILAAQLSDQFRPCYNTFAAAAKTSEQVAARWSRRWSSTWVSTPHGSRWLAMTPPQPRYGSHVQKAGIHLNPTPGPAGYPYLYGHGWVVLGLLATHTSWGVIARPLLARLHVRKKDLIGIDPKHRPAFRT